MNETNIPGETAGTLDRGDGVSLAWRRVPGRGPTLVFLPGFASDMQGDKAGFLAGRCAASGQACLRLDYSGHGESGGDFLAGSIGRWTEDALAVIDRETEGPLVLVGSSMGGWIALLVARHRPDRIAALVGIAAAPDFVVRLAGALPPPVQAILARDGVWHRPSEYGAPISITRHLLEEGRQHLVLTAPIPIAAPVRLLHGMADPDVPWGTSLELAERLAGGDVQVTLVKDGDHRLSRPADLALLWRVLAQLLGQDRGEPLAPAGVAPGDP